MFLSSDIEAAGVAIISFFCDSYVWTHDKQFQTPGLGRGTARVLDGVTGRLSGSAGLQLTEISSSVKDEWKTFSDRAIAFRC